MCYFPAFSRLCIKSFPTRGNRMIEILGFLSLLVLALLVIDQLILS